MVTENEVLESLRGVMDPELHRSIMDLGMVRELKVQDGQVEFLLALTIPECPLRDQLVQEARAAVERLPGVGAVAVRVGAMSESERREALGGDKPGAAAGHNRVDQVLAVMSGKGGVGKSLVTSLIAAALARAGRRVGILDADVTGPSIPRLFGVRGPLPMGPGGIQPAITRSGIKLISINLLLEEEDQAVIWRGPLISGAIKQFWGDVHWGNLDTLMVDLPPGTSDAALTVMQALPLDGILMVTTPQALSAMVVRKAVRMAQTVSVPILGIVENMAVFRAPDNGKEYAVFGPSHTTELAQAAAAPVLARLPLDPELAAKCDAGEVETIERPDVEALAKTVLALAPGPRMLVPEQAGHPGGRFQG